MPRRAPRPAPPPARPAASHAARGGWRRSRTHRASSSKGRCGHRHRHRLRSSGSSKAVELSVAHGPGVGALQGGEVEPLLRGEGEELLELAREESLPRRVVEPERNQRIEHPVPAEIGTVAGFHPQDGDDELRRHPEALLRPLKQRAVTSEEGCAVGDPPLVEENRTIAVPRLGLRRAIDEIDDLPAISSLPEPAKHLAGIHTEFGGHALGKGLLTRVRRPRRGRERCEKHEKTQDLHQCSRACFKRVSWYTRAARSYAEAHRHAEALPSS